TALPPASTWSTSAPTARRGGSARNGHRPAASLTAECQGQVSRTRKPSECPGRNATPWTPGVCGPGCGPQPVLPSLQARHPLHGGAVPDVRKNRLKLRKSRQETGERPPYHFL